MEKTYPISERFTSLQGEGLHAGTLMHFIRLSGCNVGKRISGAVRDPGLPIYQEPFVAECTLYDGRKFLCDTDWSPKHMVSVSDIVAGIPANLFHVCISGGEPMVHDLAPLIAAIPAHMAVHIETSGTTVTQIIDNKYLWITVSPKWNVRPEMIQRANEIKLLVDVNFQLNKLPKEVLEHPMVYLQPVNHSNEINKANVGLCLALLKRFPAWHLSIQMHKVIGVR